PSRSDDLAACYFADQRELIAEHERWFVGREDVLRVLDQFLAGHSSGYFLISGRPGLGKTSLSAHLVKTRALVHHFIGRTSGRRDSGLVLRSLLAKLFAGAGLERDLPEAVPDLTKCLVEVMTLVVRRGEQLVLVIDGLDELTPSLDGEPPPYL